MAANGESPKDVLAGIKLIFEEMREMRMDFQEQTTAMRVELREDCRRSDARLESILRTMNDQSRRRERTTIQFGRQVLKILREHGESLHRIERRLANGNGHQRPVAPRARAAAT